MLASVAAGTSPQPSPSSTFRHNDCDALVPGDALDVQGFVCDSDNARQSQSMDCKSGLYVRLTGSTATDLEGTVGSTPTWRAAEPVGPKHGRTPWAFDNRMEHA